MSSQPSVRFATEADIPSILDMIKELAIYEKALHEVQATEESLKSTLSLATSADSASNFTQGYAKTLLVFPAGSDKAAAFIAAEFKKAGLQPVANGSYLQSFSVFKPKFLGLEATERTGLKRCIVHLSGPMPVGPDYTTRLAVYCRLVSKCKVFLRLASDSFQQPIKLEDVSINPTIIR